MIEPHIGVLHRRLDAHATISLLKTDRITHRYTVKIGTKTKNETDGNIVNILEFLSFKVI